VRLFRHSNKRSKNASILGCKLYHLNSDGAHIPLQGRYVLSYERNEALIRLHRQHRPEPDSREAIQRGARDQKLRHRALEPAEAQQRRLIWWADRIFCMEEHHKQAVLEIDPEAEQKTFVLGIEDVYWRGDPELEELLKEKVGKHLSAG
jgi:predicted protein tyrosine phosphatase